ncbi:MAG: IS200/IS605 family transposase [Armatimonadota bacterium]
METGGGKQMPGSYLSLYYHIIFSTKQRQCWLEPDVRPRLWSYMGGIFKNHHAVPIAIGGVEDHVHIIASLHQTVTVADTVRRVKAHSSLWLKETFPALREFAWQEAYAGFTIHFGLLDSATGYVVNQEEHHREQSFQDEVVRFLKRHGVQYDERYMWK